MDLTGKQKRYLRSLAVTMRPVVQVGKGGVSDEILTGIRAAVDSRELIKVQILQNSEVDAADLATILEEDMGFNVVQIIGRNLVVFKVASLPKNRKISIDVQEM